MLVSLWTRPEPEVSLGPFLTRLQVPTDLAPPSFADSATSKHDPDQHAGKSSGTSLEESRWAAENGRQLLLVNLLHLRRGARGVGFLKAYRNDLKGLLIGFTLSVGLIFGVWLLLRI